MRSEAEIDGAVERYADTIRRICLYRLKNQAETEDVFQNVFLKYMLYDGDFADGEHEKAWFIRVAINACKDSIKSRLRRGALPLEAVADETVVFMPEQRETLEGVLSLPAKYKDAIYLHYYENYSAKEIAAIIRSKENTVYSLLSRGRAMLKERLGGDDLGE